MSRFATIEEGIEEVRQVRMVVVVDDESRENEGDLVLAAQFATPAWINVMATNGRGLVCLALTPERCGERARRALERASLTSTTCPGRSNCRWPPSCAMCAEAARGVQSVALEIRVPCGFGVLTVDTYEQALARAGEGKRDTGAHAAEAVLAVLEVKRATAGAGAEEQRA